jgi:DNA replication protein DnaC
MRSLRSSRSFFSQRYERGSIIVTSNLPFDEWTAVRA